MAYTTPKTWAVGDVLTASDMNTYVRDNISYLYPAHSAYSPTIGYSGGTTDPTSATVSLARYVQVGDLVTMHVYISVTRGGGDRTTVTVSLPVTAANANVAVAAVHSLRTTAMTGAAYLSNTTTITLLLGGAMTSDGVIRLSCTYEAA